MVGPFTTVFAHQSTGIPSIIHYEYLSELFALYNSSIPLIFRFKPHLNVLTLAKLFPNSTTQS